MQKNPTSKLDLTVSFLAKRDGIDKTLKIIRYASKLALATLFVGSNSEAAVRLSNLESSIGTSRKAYRLGKFLGNVNSMRKTPVRAPFASLELIANGGECVYYFVEQFQWLVKAGVLPERYSRSLGKLSSLGELIGYVASITLGILRISLILEREVALSAELERRRRSRGDTIEPLDEKDEHLAGEIRLLRARRVLRTLGMAQDLADALMAIADLRDSKAGLLSNRAVLATAGLLSGSLSAYKNWPGVQR